MQGLRVKEEVEVPDGPSHMWQASRDILSDADMRCLVARDAKAAVVGVASCYD